MVSTPPFFKQFIYLENLIFIVDRPKTGMPYPRVKLITILIFASGVFLILSATGAFFYLTFLDQILMANGTESGNVTLTLANSTTVSVTKENLQTIKSTLNNLVTILGGLSIAIAIANFFTGWLFYNIKQMARRYSFIIALLTIAVSMASLLTLGIVYSLIAMIINIAILYLISRPNVKGLFDKSLSV